MVVVGEDVGGAQWEVVEEEVRPEMAAGGADVDVGAAGVAGACPGEEGGGGECVVVVVDPDVFGAADGEVDVGDVVVVPPVKKSLGMVFGLHQAAPGAAAMV